MTNIQKLIDAYSDAIAFTDCTVGEDDAGGGEWSEQMQDRIDADCKSFYYRARPYIEAGGGDYHQAGHDFWLSRNHHGAGFWDGDWPEPYGDVLDKIAKSYGEVDVVVGDDNLVYVE